MFEADEVSEYEGAAFSPAFKARNVRGNESESLAPFRL